jgi:hypothetical protein
LIWACSASVARAASSKSPVNVTDISLSGASYFRPAFMFFSMLRTNGRSGPATTHARLPPVRSRSRAAATPPMKWASFSFAPTVA